RSSRCRRGRSRRGRSFPWWRVPRVLRGSCALLLRGGRGGVPRQQLSVTDRVEERVVLRRGARGDPQVSRYSVVPDQDAPVEDPAPGGVRVREPAELDEVRVRLGRLVPEGAQLGDQPLPFRLQLLDVLQQQVGVVQGGQGGRLGGRRQVVGQPDEL